MPQFFSKAASQLRLVGLSSHTSTCSPARSAGGRAACLFVCQLQGNAEDKFRALLWPAVYPDFPAQQGDQFLRDGQAQPGAAIAAGGAVVGLGKGIKDDALFFRCNADAGIAHRKSHQVAIPLLLAVDVQHDLPCLVNFTALPSRLFSTWRRRDGSLIAVGQVGGYLADDFQLAFFGLEGKG
jgi:hypothetical protein